MTEEGLNRCKAFLTYFNVNFKNNVIYLTDGGNSCVMNPNTEWKEFLGHSINSVAKELNKKVVWKE